MTVENETSLPDRDVNRAVTKQKDFTEADFGGDTETVWKPVTGKKAIVEDVIIFLREMSAKIAIFQLQIFRKGAWEDIVLVGLEANGITTFNHSFKGLLDSDVGNGTADMVRRRKLGTPTSTNFMLKVLIVGRVK